MYRAANLPQEEILNYKIGEKITLHGHISTSSDFKSAIKFACEPINVIYEIRWSSKINHYIMDKSFFSNEKEVLLADGAVMTINDIQTVEDNK